MDAYLPAEVSPLLAVALIALSTISSALTASLGAGGGMLMLGAMAATLPPLALIPVHGLVQLGSNGGRAVMSRRHIAVRLSALLLAGGAGGALAGSLVLVQLPVAWLQVAVAVFLLWVVWAPLPPIGTGSRAGIVSFGAMTGFLSLFVGATGPLVSAFVQRLAPDRHAAIATMAACMSGLNVYKLAAFSAAGFAWREWIALCAVLILAGLIGTRVGLGALGRIPEARFRLLFRITVTALGAHAAWQGLTSLAAR